MSRLHGAQSKIIVYLTLVEGDLPLLLLLIVQILSLSLFHVVLPFSVVIASGRRTGAREWLHSSRCERNKIGLCLSRLMTEGEKYAQDQMLTLDDTRPA